MQRPADRAHIHAQHWGPSLTLTVFRCAGGGGCFTTLPENPVFQQVLQRAPSCPAAQAPSGNLSLPPPPASHAVEVLTVASMVASSSKPY